MFPITYQEPLFRPPSEAYSLIFQVTLGCSWNQCAFCQMYGSKSFSVKKEDEVIAEIRRAAPMAPHVNKVFLADGNAMVLSTPKLLRILETLNETFPRLRRISTYALPRDILSKSPSELEALREAGLQLLYVGIESGDDDVLRMINKNETADSTVEGLKKAQDAGINNSVMIINGLAGSTYSRQHAIHSAEVINRIQPYYLSTLVLMLHKGIDHYREVFAGEYKHMETAELLAELKVFMEHLELERTIFRSDHVSNYLVLKGTLSRDKERLLKTIDEAKAIESSLKPGFEGEMMY